MIQSAIFMSRRINASGRKSFCDSQTSASYLNFVVSYDIGLKKRYSPTPTHTHTHTKGLKKSHASNSEFLRRDESYQLFIFVSLQLNVLPVQCIHIASNNC